MRYFLAQGCSSQEVKRPVVSGSVIGSEVNSGLVVNRQVWRSDCGGQEENIIEYSSSPVVKRSSSEVMQWFSGQQCERFGEVAQGVLVASQ